MLIRTKEFPEQKYEVDDLTKFSLRELKRRYELGMIFTAMLSQESDPRAPKAVIILALQMKNIWNEWRSRMATRELAGLPTFEIWQRVSTDELIKTANRDPRCGRRPIPSDQVVVLNTLSVKRSL